MGIAVEGRCLGATGTDPGLKERRGCHPPGEGGGGGGSGNELHESVSPWIVTSRLLNCKRRD